MKISVHLSLNLLWLCNPSLHSMFCCLPFHLIPIPLAPPQPSFYVRWPATVKGATESQLIKVQQIFLSFLYCKTHIDNYKQIPLILGRQKFMNNLPQRTFRMHIQYLEEQEPRPLTCQNKGSQRIAQEGPKPHPAQILCGHLVCWGFYLKRLSTLKAVLTNTSSVCIFNIFKNHIFLCSKVYWRGFEFRGNKYYIHQITRPLHLAFFWHHLWLTEFFFSNFFFKVDLLCRNAFLTESGGLSSLLVAWAKNWACIF